MSIFSKIKSAIFGEKGPLGSGHFGTPKPAAPAPAPQTPAPQTTAAQPQAAPTPQAAPAATPVTAPAPQSVDVEAVLSGIASRKNSDLNWRTSIVDLMKLLDLDSSLDNRKELATELGYTGAKDGSAEMNIWLHKAVMRELAKNGGTVPAGLKD
jgi:3-oxoacyl-ACP reductase-like protein